jgi:hypothetical protein
MKSAAMWNARPTAMLQWVLRGLFGKGSGVLTKGRLQEVESDEHGRYERNGLVTPAATMQ